MDKTQQKKISNLNKDIGRTIYKYKLIEDNDVVLVGLSGGKDSYVLLEALADRKKHIPFHFELIAGHIHVANLNYKVDTAFMKDICQHLKIRFVLKEIEIDFNKDKEKGACFVCSWHRRKALFSLTQELKCNKLALGHHLDDAIETLLMNMIFHASVSSLPQKISMFQGRLQIIRPLLFHTREVIQQYADIRHYPKELKSCSFGDVSKREEMKTIISLMEKMNKRAKINLFRSHQNICFDYLPER